MLRPTKASLKVLISSMRFFGTDSCNNVATLALPLRPEHSCLPHGFRKSAQSVTAFPLASHNPLGLLTRSRRVRGTGGENSRPIPAFQESLWHAPGPRGEAGNGPGVFLGDFGPAKTARDYSRPLALAKPRRVWTSARSQRTVGSQFPPALNAPPSTLNSL